MLWHVEHWIIAEAVGTTLFQDDLPFTDPFKAVDGPARLGDGYDTPEACPARRRHLAQHVNELGTAVGVAGGFPSIAGGIDPRRTAERLDF
jgi:hypothetical protein